MFFYPDVTLDPHRGLGSNHVGLINVPPFKVKTVKMV